jgi:aminopeptidase-like protein
MEKINQIEIKNSKGIGKDIYELIQDLYPICRSITGNGVRETLNKIKQHIPLNISEVPTGTKVFDWEVPKEWNINDAYIKNSKGEKIVDFKKSNLHVLNYSIPIHKKISLTELKKHIFTLPEHPDWIPYRTSYYEENWGFCITHNQFQNLRDEQYEVCIESSLIQGSLTYGEIFLKGKIKDEVLLSCYVCHPSMCNDNLSGVSLLTYLAREINKVNHNLSYRFLFIPETIGAITWLSKNEKKINNIKHGLVATCVGDSSGKMTYKKTRNGNNIIDKIVTNVLTESKEPFEIVDFFPTGSDERQFCSPGFNLPIGSLMRTIYDKFEEYHTSADNLNYVNSKSLENSFEKYLKIIKQLEEIKVEEKESNQKNVKNKIIIKSDEEIFYNNLNPKCEPQLGRRGLYNMVGGQKNSIQNMLPIFWVLNLSDGTNSISDIVKKSNLEIQDIKNAINILIKKNLLKMDTK